MAKQRSQPARKPSSTSRARKGTTTPARRTSRASTQQRSSWWGDIRQEHQREIFALLLILVAAVTVFFYIFADNSGLLGQRWLDGLRQGLGWGALMVPLALGLLGAAIIWRERYEDLELSGATIAGTFLLLAALQALLEFGMEPRASIAERAGEGGGMVGYALLTSIGNLIGRPAAFVCFLFVGLIGILLTFNITLQELLEGLRSGATRVWLTLWSGGGRKPQQQGTPPRALPQSKIEPAPFTLPPGAEEDEFVATPIAARQTRASLFNRPDPKAPSQQEAPKPAKAAKQPEPTPEAVLNSRIETLQQAKPAPTAEETVQEALENFDVPSVIRAWPLPKVDVLSTYAEGTISPDDLKFKARLIEETLASFKVEALVKSVNTGPAVTQFEVQPAVGVKVSKIVTLEKDLALALAAQSIRIEAPIPGKAFVGIEIPNSSTSIVGLRDVIESDEFDRAKSKLKLPLGKDVSGTPVVAGMERMPHLLVAGSTGSGKSVAVNGFICALLLKHTPEELKFIMVDPKMVELIVYNNVPHLLSPVVTELERVVPTLKWAVKEMERRYKIFAKHGFRNLDSYKQASRHRADLEPMPYIVLIIDELADLMMMAPDEVETLICRLAQMARATGIHLIIATQRPSVDVVTGLIKANFPSRISFAVTSQIDSRVILDTNGAEQLLGRGDMLFLSNDAAKPVRIQGTFVSDEEVERIVSFWRDARPPEDAAPTGAPTDGAAPVFRPAPPKIQGPGEFLSADEQDELLPAAIKLVQQHTRASASLLQRRLRIGYSKAAQLIDLLEQQGYVGPAEDGRSREVIKDE